MAFWHDGKSPEYSPLKNKKKSEVKNELFAKKFQNGKREEILKNIKEVISSTIQVLDKLLDQHPKKYPDLNQEKYKLLKESIKDNVLAQLIFLKTLAKKFPVVEERLKKELSKAFKKLIRDTHKANSFINFLLGIVKSNDADSKVLTSPENKLLDDLASELSYYIQHGFVKLFDDFEEKNKIKTDEIMRDLKPEDVFQNLSENKDTNKNLEAFLELDPVEYEKQTIRDQLRKDGMEI